MIEINREKQTYVCPFCGHLQAYQHSYNHQLIGYCVFRNTTFDSVPSELKNSSFLVLSLKCNNDACQEISLIAFNCKTEQQFDLLPQFTCRQFPEYVPYQIRNDYTEACAIIQQSPKAAATLLRRCLQGMIHDYWDIHEKNLNAEITALKDRISPTQWSAIDALRSIGNIGAHMEHDVNLIIEIDLDEANKLRRLIELLIDKWYIARHDEECLFADISGINEDKQAQRGKK